MQLSVLLNAPTTADENEIVVAALPVAGTLITNGATVNSAAPGATQVTVPMLASGLVKVTVAVVAVPPTANCGSVSVVPLTGAEVIGNGSEPSTKLKVSMPI